MPGTRCTRSPCAKVIAHGSHHESTGIPGIPARNGFNGLFRALPGDEFFLSPSSADQRRNNTRSGLRASADLTPATDARTTRLRRTRFILAKRLRRHVHDRRSIDEDGSSAVRPCGPRSFTSQSLPCDLKPPDAAASTASHPNVRDDRDTPLVRDETGGICR